MTESQGCPFTYIFPAPGRAWLPGYEAGLSDLPADILFQHDFHILGCFLFFFFAVAVVTYKEGLG